LRLSSGSSATYYKIAQTTSSYGTPYGVEVQEDDTDSSNLIIAFSYINGGTTYHRVLKVDLSSNTISSLSYTYTSSGGVTNVLDVSYYGGYVAFGDNGGYHLYDVANNNWINQETTSAVKALDLSEDASVFLPSMGGLSYYYTTGVSEDQPVPVPENLLLVVIGLLGGLLFLSFKYKLNNQLK